MRSTFLQVTHNRRARRQRFLPRRSQNLNQMIFLNPMAPPSTENNYTVIIHKYFVPNLIGPTICRSDAESFASSDSEQKSKLKKSTNVDKVVTPARTGAAMSRSVGSGGKHPLPNAKSGGQAPKATHVGVQHGARPILSISNSQQQHLSSSSSLQSVHSTTTVAAVSDDITKGPPVNSESQAKKLIVQVGSPIYLFNFSISY